MSYESRVIVGVRTHNEGTRARIDYANPLAVFDLGVVDIDGFYDLFCREVDFKIYALNENTPVKTDKYGRECKYSSFDDIKYFFEDNEIDRDYYPTLYAFSKFVKGLEDVIGFYEYGYGDGSFEELVFVHYGY